ncbi:MAG: hypothetical protein AAF982_07660 [Pseudomonadota bacterium]
MSGLRILFWPWRVLRFLLRRLSWLLLGISLIASWLALTSERVFLAGSDWIFETTGQGTVARHHQARMDALRSQAADEEELRQEQEVALAVARDRLAQAEAVVSSERARAAKADAATDTLRAQISETLNETAQGLSEIADAAGSQDTIDRTCAVLQRLGSSLAAVGTDTDLTDETRRICALTPAISQFPQSAPDARRPPEEIAPTSGD